MDDAKKAMALLIEGGFKTGPEWVQAHEICQAHEGERVFDAIHALAHLIEGDKPNSDYWCRRAGISPLGADAAAAAASVSAEFSLD